MADSAEIDGLIGQISYFTNTRDKLLAIGEPALRRLLEVLATPDDQPCVIPYQDIREQLPPRTSALSDLANAFPDAFFAAIRQVQLNRTLVHALNDIKDERVTDLLLEAMDAEDHWIRYFASGFLINRASIGTEPSLGWQLEKNMIESQGGRRMQRPAGRRLIEPFIKALRDPDEGVRKNAVTALFMFGDARALNPLRDLLNSTADHNHLWVRQSAEYAIRCIEAEVNESPSSD
jgi:HEAT repeat protein